MYCVPYRFAGFQRNDTKGWAESPLVSLPDQRRKEPERDEALRRESAAETLAWTHKQGRRFDLIAVFWLLLREQFAVLPSLLPPGGLLIDKTFRFEHRRFAAGGSTRFALHPGELGASFPGLATILYREDNGIAELVACSG
jgi:hypothetical protein